MPAHVYRFTWGTNGNYEDVSVVQRWSTRADNENRRWRPGRGAGYGFAAVRTDRNNHGGVVPERTRDEQRNGDRRTRYGVPETEDKRDLTGPRTDEVPKARYRK